MADESQVEQAIVDLASATVYPNGTGSSSALGVGVALGRGWPTESYIQSAVSANKVLVAVHGVKGLSRDVTRFQRNWLELGVEVVTLTATIAGQSITFSGTPAVGQYVGVVSGGLGYTYVVQASDTLDTIAAALAAAIPSASASGAVLTLPAGMTLPEVSVGLSGSTSVEAGRQQQNFMVVVWAPTPQLRDSAMQLLIPALTYTYRLSLTDGSIATLMDFQETGPIDTTLKAGEWRRDLRLDFDYPVTYTQIVPPVAVGALQTTVAGNVTTSYTAE